VEAFKRLGIEGVTKYAIEHAETVERFGRFPHRNEVMGRESTPEDAAFLAAGASRNVHRNVEFLH
jgi:uncharacterized protein (DUF924 family)